MGGYPPSVGSTRSPETHGGMLSPTGAVVMPSPRFKFPEALALLADGRVLIAGGAEQPEVYDPARNVFVPTSGRLDAARFYSTATRLNDGRVLVAGGYDRTGVATNRAWIYRP